MRSLGRFPAFPFRCGCGCTYWENLFPGPSLNAHWTVNGGSASIAAPTRQATCTAVLGNFVVSGATITAAGTGYATPPTVGFSGGGGSGAAATAEVSPAGQVVRIDITNPGAGYTSAPTIALVGGGGSGATATAAITGGVVGVTIGDGGAGYTQAPQVRLIGGGGGGARATAAIGSGGAVAGITVWSAGNYSSPPTVEISGGGGGQVTLAAGTTIVSDVLTPNQTAYGTVLANIAFASSSPPGTVVRLICNYTDPGDYAFAEYALIVVGVAVTMTDQGSGYTSAPSVTFSGGGAATQATGIALLDGSPGGPYTISGVAMTGQGSGYTSAPSVTFSGGKGTGAAGTATLEIQAVIRCGVRTGGTDTYGGTIAEADNPTLGTSYGGVPLTGGSPFQLCYAPDRIVATAQFLASMVGAGFATTIGSSQCGVASASGAIIQDFRLSQSATKQAGCPVPAAVCGQWNYSDLDAFLTYAGLCDLAPEQWILDLGGTGLTNGVTGLASQGVASITITDGGSGYYFVGQTITANFSGGDGSGATAQVSTVDGAGHVTGVYVTAEGSGYTSAPTVTFTDPNGGTGATGTAVLGPVYIPQPCTGCASVSGEYTLSQCPWDAGSADHDPAPWANSQCYPAHPVPPAYVGAPNTPGGQCKWCYYGTTPLCDSNSLFQAGVGIYPTTIAVGPVLSLTLTAAGNGYTSAPSITISGGGGTGATARAVIQGSPLSGLTLTAAGSGYTSAPSIAISGGGGTGATARAVIQGGYVSAITLTAVGSGYTSPPAVNVSGGGGTGATAAAATVGGYVSAITLTAGGSGYTSNPALTFAGGAGTGATATASAVGVPGYFFEADLYISSLPIPSTCQSVFYSQVLWQAHYRSAAFPVLTNPNCTDPLGGGHALALNLSSSTALAWFGGYLCGTDATGNPPSIITLKY
ncbi:MAG: hypothetical protein ACLQLG_13585 [Thermoguttaceae bacterium]